MIKSNKINVVDFDTQDQVYFATQITDKKSKSNHKFDVKKMGKGLFHHEERIQYFVPENQQQIPTLPLERKHKNRQKLIVLNFDQSEEEAESNFFFMEKQTNKTEENTLKITLNDVLQKIDKIQFSYSPIQDGKILSSLILLPSTINIFTPQYNMVLAQDQTHILSCKKKLCSFGSNYYVSTSENVGEQDQHFLGKIRTGKDDYRFNVFKKTKSINKQIVSTVVFSRKKGLKHIQLYFLRKNVKYEELSGNQGKTVGLDVLYRVSSNYDKIIMYSNRKPSFRSKSQTFAFSQKIASSTERQIIIEEPKTQRQVLTFSKISENMYRLNISAPLSPFIGFAVIVPSFQIK